MSNSHHLTTSMTTQSQNTALIFGATGISGWSVARNALIYPTPAIFQRVIGLMHRPRTIEEIGLPEDPRLELYSGVDLSAELDDVIADLKKKIPCLEDVTHVYYLGQLYYIPKLMKDWEVREF